MSNVKQLISRFFKSDGFKDFLSSLICVALGLVCGIIIIVIVNAENSPIAIAAIFKGGFNHAKWKKGVGEVITNSIPLLLCSLSIIFAYKCGLFNIGAPGQYVMGTMFALLGAFAFKAPWYVCLILSAIGGALWGIIPGIFKAFLNVNEVITSIMFNWIGLHILNYVAGGEANIMYNAKLSECYPLPTKALLPNLGSNKIFDGFSYVTIAVFVAIILAILIQIILTKTKFGYEIKATGHNKDAAKYAGMSYKKNIILTMAIAGALAGIAAGCFYLTGMEIYSATKNTATLPSVGFNGIAAAFLGGLNPIGAIVSSLLITHITVAGGYLDTNYYPKEIGDLIAAIIIYLCAFSLFIKSIINKRQAKKQQEEKILEIKKIQEEVK
ncbi:MAG: ABC transporter permease [Candidatus Caccosoma sp.]|nr:ABC transporter permease [Candidatus Caccosoma sp.]